MEVKAYENFEVGVRIRNIFGFAATEEKIKEVITEMLEERLDAEVIEIYDVKISEGEAETKNANKYSRYYV